MVSTRNHGEADRLYLIYTRDFGMVLASAKSVRTLKSKLRLHIESGALLSITLLKSKNHWKLLEVVAEERLLQRTESYKIFLRLLTVLKTLAFGEERNNSLFEVVTEVFKYLKNPENDKIVAAECLAMLKIMHSLGYGEPDLPISIATGPFNNPNLELVENNKNQLITGINKTLKQTGL